MFHEHMKARGGVAGLLERRRENYLCPPMKKRFGAFSSGSKQGVYTPCVEESKSFALFTRNLVPSKSQRYTAPVRRDFLAGSQMNSVEAFYNQMTITNRKQLHERLWSAAVQLRANGSLKLNEISEPILGLIFLKFADVRFKQATMKSKVNMRNFLQEGGVRSLLTTTKRKVCFTCPRLRHTRT